MPSELKWEVDNNSYNMYIGMIYCIVLSIL